MSKILRPGSPFWAWVWAGAVCCACIGILNPTIWYSADVLGAARFLAAAVGAVFGGILGAVAGAVIGFFAALRSTSRPAPTDKKAAARRAQSARMTTFGLIVGGLVLGIGGGAFNLTTTPEKGSFTACTTIQKDFSEAQAALTNGVPGTTIARTNDALKLTKSCNGSFGGKLYTGALYALRGAAYAQVDLLPARSNADIKHAGDLIKNCKTEEAGTERAPMCATFLTMVERYGTQHFCDEAVAFANRADNEFYTNAAAAKADAQRGVVSAGKCKNQFNFAYRGIALAQRGQAQAALGESAAATLNEAQGLVGRCMKTLGTGRGLGAQCKAAQATIAAVRAGRSRPGS